MRNYFLLLMLISVSFAQAQHSLIRENVMISVYSYEHENKIKGAAMPDLSADSKFMPYKRRFEYILLNTPEIHLLQKRKDLIKIFDVYPDTSAMKKMYLNKLITDKKFTGYFKETANPISHPGIEIKKTYTVNELMDVASKFFYCDQVNEDTTVQSHVCIGVNGLKEVKWKKDYTLLAAFCYEAIFTDFDKDTSIISQSYSDEKSISYLKYRNTIITLDKFLEDVKLELFRRMQNSAALKDSLLKYYELNKTNLAFRIIN